MTDAEMEAWRRGVEHGRAAERERFAPMLLDVRAALREARALAGDRPVGGKIDAILKRIGG